MNRPQVGGFCGCLAFIMLGLVVGMILVVFAPIVFVLLMVGGIAGSLAECVPSGGGQTVSVALDLSDVADESRPVIDTLPDDFTIPANYYQAYKAAADAYGMDWEILAAIGWRESKHGTYEAAWRENDAHAMGPMQFIPAAWDHHGVHADGTPGTPPLKNRNNLADAVASAANKLTDQGINTDEVEALFRYNNAMWYVRQIQDHAAVFKSGQYTVMDGDGNSQSGGDSGGIISAFPAVSAADFDIDCSAMQNVSWGAAQAPDEITAQAVEFALDQVGKPYCWGGTGPSCYDCSGLLHAAYSSAGVSLPERMSQYLWNVGERIPEDEIMPGDFIFFKVDMSRREDSAHGNPGHVAMVVGPGEMVEAWCTDCGPIAVRGWEDRDVMGFTRPLLDERLSHHLPEDVEDDRESDAVLASVVTLQDRPGARLVLGRAESAVASRRRPVR